MATETSFDVQRLLEIDLKNITLQGDLSIPENATQLVIFSHGSGSSRKSPRNKYVAKQLQDKGIATLLTDLLTEKEDEVYETRFDIDLLTDRLVEITDWLQDQPELVNLSFGYFGASTGAASALRAAVVKQDIIKTVVSRGGRPDLAMPVLDQIKIPVLLIVGSRDEQVIDLNQKAYKALAGEKEMHIVDGATHLFEEPGALEEVADVAAEWYDTKL